MSLRTLGDTFDWTLRYLLLKLQLNIWLEFLVAYFNGAHDKLAESLKLLERYQEENRDEIDKPSILETADTNGKCLHLKSWNENRVVKN